MPKINARLEEQAKERLRARLGGHIALRLAEMAQGTERQLAGGGVRLQLLGAP